MGGLVGSVVPKTPVQVEPVQVEPWAETVPPPTSVTLRVALVRPVPVNADVAEPPVVAEAATLPEATPATAGWNVTVTVHCPPAGKGLPEHRSAPSTKGLAAPVKLTLDEGLPPLFETTRSKDTRLPTSTTRKS